MRFFGQVTHVIFPPQRWRRLESKIPTEPGHSIVTTYPLKLWRTIKLFGFKFDIVRIITPSSIRPVWRPMKYSRDVDRPEKDCQILESFKQNSVERKHNLIPLAALCISAFDRECPDLDHARAATACRQRWELSRLSTGSLSSSRETLHRFNTLQTI